MGMFAKLGNAAISDDKGRLVAGMYKVEVVQLIQRDTLQSGQFLFLEFKVLESSNEAIVQGSLCSQGIGLSWINAMTHLKSFLHAVVVTAGDDPADLFDPAKAAAIADRAFDGDGTSLAGMVLGVEATVKTSKKSGKDFTSHRWFVLEDEAEAEGGDEAEAPSW